MAIIAPASSSAASTRASTRPARAPGWSCTRRCARCARRAAGSCERRRGSTRRSRPSAGPAAPAPPPCGSRSRWRPPRPGRRRNSARVVTAGAERHLDDVRLLEVERLAELDAGHRRQPQQVIVDADISSSRSSSRLANSNGLMIGEPLGQHLIPHLHGHPRREVVAVGGGDGPVAEEVAVRVIEDRAGRHVLQAVHQLALVRARADRAPGAARRSR